MFTPCQILIGLAALPCQLVVLSNLMPASCMAQVEKRYVYTTPKTFLELIRLYKNVLGRKRQQVQEAIDRLDTGLAKLQKTQREVDVLVEEAKIKAVEVEKKVADADVFAEQVGQPMPTRSSRATFSSML